MIDPTHPPLFTPRRRLAAGALAATALIALSGCSGGGGAGSNTASTEGALADMDPVTISYTDVSAETSITGIVFHEWADLLAERSDGKITLEGYFSASLVPGTEFLSATGDGIVDMAGLPVAYNPQELPISNWQMQLGSLPSESFPQGILSGAAAVNEIFQEDADITAEFAGKGLHVVGASNPVQEYDLLCTKPVESLDDAKGLRVRVASAVGTAEVEALGMTAVSMPSGDQYEALQRGVIDCVAGSPNGNIQASLWEVATEWTPVNMSTYPGIVWVMNQEKWDSLPPEAQQLFTETFFEVMWRGYLQAGLDSYSLMLGEGVDEHGITLHDPTAINAALAPFQDEEVERALTTAPGTLSDADGFVTLYRSTLDDWAGFVTDDLGIPESGSSVAERQKAYGAVDDLDLEKYWSKVATGE